MTSRIDPFDEPTTPRVAINVRIGFILVFLSAILTEIGSCFIFDIFPDLTFILISCLNHSIGFLCKISKQEKSETKYPIIPIKTMISISHNQG